MVRCRSTGTAKRTAARKSRLEKKRDEQQMYVRYCFYYSGVFGAQPELDAIAPIALTISTAGHHFMLFKSTSDQGQHLLCVGSDRKGKTYSVQVQCFHVRLVGVLQGDLAFVLRIFPSRLDVFPEK